MSHLPDERGRKREHSGDPDVPILFAGIPDPIIRLWPQLLAKRETFGVLLVASSGFLSPYVIAISAFRGQSL